MLSATILALASLSAPLPGATSSMPVPAYASPTIAGLKGKHVSPVRRDPGKTRTSANGCHPDPHKGRSCRVHVAKREQLAREAFAKAEIRGETDAARVRRAAP